MSYNPDASKRNLIITFFLRGASKIVTYFLLLILANYFAVAEYGKAFYYLSYFQLLITIILFGAPFSIVPFLTKRKFSNEIFSLLFYISILAGAILLIVSQIKPNLLPISIILPLSISLPFISYHRYQLAALQSRHKHHLNQLSYLILMIIPLLFAYSLRKYNASGIIIAYALGFIFTPIITCFFLRENLLSKLVVKIKLSFIKQFVPLASYTSIVMVSFLVLSWIDVILLGFIKTSTDVARYHIAFLISNVIVIIPQSISMWMLTRSTQLSNTKYSVPVLRRAIRITILLSVCVMIVLSSFLSTILSIFLPLYKGIEPYAIILSMGVVFYSVYLLGYVHLTGNFKQKKVIFPMVLTLALNILLDILLIPKYNLYGITIATLIAHFVAFILISSMLSLLKHNLPIILIAFFIPLSYYLGYYGVLMLIPAIIVLFALKLLKLTDIIVCIRPIRLLLRS